MRLASKRLHGFSLLEILVALAIFAVIAALAWGGLDVLARSRFVLEVQSQKLAELQRGFGRFERDIRQAVPRSVRADGAISADALSGDNNGVELTTWLPAGGWAQATPGLQRVAWRCVDAGLQRSAWAAPDYTSATPRSDALMVKNVSACRFVFYPERGPPSDRWPMPGKADVLPRAVEIIFSRNEQDQTRETFRRLIELPRNSELAP